MDKASMLYNRFKNTFLVGEGEEVVSAAFLRSLLEQKEREERDRAELWRRTFLKEARPDGGEGDEAASDSESACLQQS